MEQELGEEAGHLYLDGRGGVELHLRALAQFLQYVHLESSSDGVACAFSSLVAISQSIFSFESAF
jgi:hypothetical protein